MVLKRGLDVIGSLVLIVALSPVFGIIALAIWISMGSPVLFRQERAGYKGQPFTILKFRTMTDKRDSNGQLLPNEVRMTRLGRFLRHSSLDELPELLNVLRGDMSMVGPRPLHTRYILRYTPEQARRHDMKPGITGLAQVSGRNMLSWEEKFELDIQYVDHWSFWMDLRIIWMTFWKVATREGVTPGGCDTVAEFTGGHKTVDK